MTTPTNTSADDERRHEALISSIVLWLGTMSLKQVQRVDAYVMAEMRGPPPDFTSAVLDGLRELRGALVVPTRRHGAFTWDTSGDVSRLEGSA